MMHSPDFWRMIIFVGLLAIFMLLEFYKPKHTRRMARSQRWPANLSLIAINAVVLKLIFPVSAVTFALWIQQMQFGVLNLLALPWFIAIPLAVVLLDLAIYWQHRLFHQSSLLWRVHRMHHVDPDYDVTLGLRFHPIEIVLSMIIKFTVIALLGAPMMAVFVFEIILNAMAMFNHSNIRLPIKVDAKLRLLLVTPDMHRVHHSTLRDEHNANYGFNLSCWDRWFNSYVAQPKLGHQDIQFGLSSWRKAQDNRQLKGLLSLPFRSSK
ncbi:sterol desaturase family protein [Agarivorans sp. MS3-6]|uniref:sterol desaturase family protein n=1 Tax=Agarivorans sp. TSD2052 TaxID=2937286 RepID=UPI00200D070F|nr:sterol desaturase family protein [Agarivorans sp. TSD2052]UPW19271.1 sterol desaturase family protein [Agarivorans sp. TSD2052]